VIEALTRTFLSPARWKRRLFYVATDALVVVVASLLTYTVAARAFVPTFARFVTFVLPYAGLGLGCQVGLSILFSSYNLRWSTYSLADVPRSVAPGAVTAVLLALASGFGWFETLTPWAALTWGMLNTCGVIAVRGSRRFYEEVLRRNAGKRAVLIVSSEKAYFLLDTMRRLPRFNYRLVGFVDPEPRNRGTTSQGMPVLGTFEDIDRIVARHRIRAAFVFLCASPTRATGPVYERLRELGVEVRLIPSFADVVENRPESEVLERLALHELTGREPVTVDPIEMQRTFGGRRIMVTGAGGSIGSELCRQLARFDPAQLVLFERDDSNLFGTERELLATHPDLEVLPFLGDVAHDAAVDRVFEQTRPHIVFHAAAYKHVPILEFHPDEAARVNVLGSHAIARAAIRHGTESVVYVSTDKAVNPTSVMGASKRLGEMVVTSMNGLGDVKFLAVRFGNVLASRGSVSTIFSEAIARRRPITVTHPDMQRYFMLTSEAVLLVMQAVCLGRGGEVFVLDMGRPVRIMDLAEAMIRDAGLQPGVDIPILTTGKRPGEKLFEELLTAEEGTMATLNQRIRRARISKQHCYPELTDGLTRLETAVRSHDPETVRSELCSQVSTFTPDPVSPSGHPTASGRARSEPGKKKPEEVKERVFAGSGAGFEGQVMRVSPGSKFKEARK
jgi:FlaA1/EpsC-like NDP-sugar epimerase